MLLLLSGDVERNPGPTPTINDRPDMSLLIQWLQPLVEWKAFGFCLPKVSSHDVLKIEQEYIKIEDRKSALYSKWLSANPNATWKDVIDALTSMEENTLAQRIKNKIASNALSIRSSLSPSTSNSDGKLYHRHIV